MENATEKIRKNKALVRDALVAVYNKPPSAAVDEAINKYYASDYRLHRTFGPEAYGREDVKALVQQRRALLSDSTTRVDEQLAPSLYSSK